MAFNYKDPRWQKRRLEIMERDGFQCVACGSKTNELHVHHKRYKGQPWQAKDDDMQTLCIKCHTALGPHPKAGIGYDSDWSIAIDHCPACKRNQWQVCRGSVCCVAEKCNGFQCDDLVKRTSVNRLRFLTFEIWFSNQPEPTLKPVKKKKVKQGARLERGSHIAGRSWDTQLWTEAADNVGGLLVDFAQMASAVKTYQTFEEGNEILHVVVEFEEGSNGHCSPHAFLSRPEIKKQLIQALFDLCGQILTLEMIIKTTEEHNA